MLFVLIDDQRIVIVDHIRLDKNIAHISHLKSVFEQQVRKIKRNIKLYNFVVVSQYRRDSNKLIDKTIKNSLLNYINLCLIVYLHKICLYLYNEFNIIVNIDTIARMLRRER